MSDPTKPHINLDNPDQVREFLAGTPWLPMPALAGHPFVACPICVVLLPDHPVIRDRHSDYHVAIAGRLAIAALGPLGALFGPGF